MTSSARPRRLLLLDCDQFFVQCARMADPDGAGRAPLLLVGGSADARGVVTSASYETRAYGCRSGMPMAQAVRLCPDALVAPVPRGLCSEKSREVRAVLRTFTPVVEAASIDEAYLDMTGTESLYRNEPLAETARRIRSAVLAQTGIQVSIGGGTTRIVAKLAAGAAKPAGVHVVEPGGEAAFLRRFDLKDIPGVGPVLQEKLRRMGLVRVEDALPFDEATLGAMIGEGRGEWLHRRIRGIDEGEVHAHHAAKSLSHEETFPRDVAADRTLEAELHSLSLRVAADLRAAGLRARTVTVKLRDHDFRTRSAARTVDEPFESDRAIHTLARELLRSLRRRRRVPARLLGVAVSSFEQHAAAQLALFHADRATAIETDRDRRLSHALDQLRERFGGGAPRPGSLLRDDE